MDASWLRWHKEKGLGRSNLDCVLFNPPAYRPSRKMMHGTHEHGCTMDEGCFGNRILGRSFNGGTQSQLLSVYLRQNEG